MTKENTKGKKGFTIIEVVLVLAIAGLIFLMVFIALPALQRSQRDTQRRDDMARFMSQLNQYQANNAGKVPSDYTSFINQYLKAGGDSFADPSTGTDYTIVGTWPCTTGECDGSKDFKKVAEDTDARGKIYIYTNARCEGEYPKYIQGNRKIAIRIKLEGAGIYCGNN